MSTVFENRTIQAELELCQRYYEKSYNQITFPGTVTLAGSVLHLATGLPSSVRSAGNSISFKVKKSGTGISLNTYSPVTGAFNTIWFSGTDVVPTLDANNDSGFRCFATSAGAITDFDIQYHWVAEREV